MKALNGKSSCIETRRSRAVALLTQHRFSGTSLLALHSFLFRRYVAKLQAELAKVPSGQRVQFDALFGLPPDHQDTLVSTSGGPAMHEIPERTLGTACARPSPRSRRCATPQTSSAQLVKACEALDVFLCTSKEGGIARRFAMVVRRLLVELSGGAPRPRRLGVLRGAPARAPRRAPGPGGPGLERLLPPEQCRHRGRVRRSTKGLRTKSSRTPRAYNLERHTNELNHDERGTVKGTEVNGKQVNSRIARARYARARSRIA